MPLFLLPATPTFVQSAVSATYAGSAGGATGAFILSATLSVVSAVTVLSTVRASAYLVGVTQVVGTQQVAIADPVTGAVSDTVARTAISAILSALRTHGLIST